MARALLVTAGSEGSRSGNLEHSASKPGLAEQVGNLACSGKAQKLDNLCSYDGWVQVQAVLLNRGSPLASHDDG